MTECSFELNDKYFIKCFKVGTMEVNCYFVIQKKDNVAVLIDPGFEDKNILSYIKDNSIIVKKILLTHGHFDHILGINIFENAVIYIHRLDEELLANSEKNAGFFMNITSFKKPKNIKTFEDKDEIPFFEDKFEVIHTPGHTKGSSCFIFLNKVIFTGDTLFKNGVGRCDLYGGNLYDLKSSIKKIANLKENLLIYPGHGDISNLYKEKNENIYLN